KASDKTQARRNMITYLKNTAGFRLDYFKGMSYDDICPIFEVKLNAIMEFLLKSKENIKEEANRALESQTQANTITPARTKNKGKGIMIEEPKPIKKKQHVEMDEAYARKLHEELNHDIDWDVAIEHVKEKAKEDPFIQRYQVMKKRPQTKLKLEGI
nr:hypothetical protein [Tanacetum cinerariifolium]